MEPILVKKIYPEAVPLRGLIKYFWVLDSHGPITLNHTILPTNNIDLLFNFLSPMTFEKGGASFETPGNIFFSGLTDTHTLMRQRGRVQTIGVSFFPAGFYPFLRVPVSEFGNDTFGLHLLMKGAAAELEERLAGTARISGKIALLEGFFRDRLDPAALPAKENLSLLNLFQGTGLGVREFCRHHAVHPRKLERLFKKYVGATPKLFARLSRFQAALNRLTAPRREDLTALAHGLAFYDQAHFIKDFKSFTGSSPSRFLKERRSFRQNMKEA